MKRLTPLLLALLAAASAPAANLLTNEVPVFFVLPPTTNPPLLATGELAYAIYVPAGASKLTIRIEMQNPTYHVDLLVRYGSEVGYSGTAGYVFDYFGENLGLGVRQVVVTHQSSPPLQGGTYFIAFNIAGANEQVATTLQATVEGGSVLPSRTVVISQFDNDLDGWTHNSAASSLPGASQSERLSTILWESSGGRPGGYALQWDAGGSEVDAFVAPSKFLGNLSLLVEPRFEFDLKSVASGGPTYAVEVRIFGAGSAWSWSSAVLPPPPDDPLCHVSPLGMPPEVCNWRHYVASLQPSLWTRFSGEATFSQMLRNVQRIEVISDLSLDAETVGLDNFALMSRDIGQPQIVLSGNTSFVAGADGWTRNFPASDLAGASLGDPDSAFRWVPFEGNPSGYIRLMDGGGSGADAAVAPPRFLGNYSNIANPRIEFDYLHSSPFGATRPVEVRLMGAGSLFLWTGAIPETTWTHYVAPLSEAAWRRAFGTATLSAALVNVERIEVTMDQADGPESNAIDNFWVNSASAPPPPPAMAANPAALSFTAVARGSNPQAQRVSVTSSGGNGSLSFEATADSSGWLRITTGRGATPRVFNAWADVTGLPEGTYTGRITVKPVGPNLSPSAITVTLTVAARPGPTPRINTGGAVNAASNRTQLAAGGLGTIYGTGLGPTPGALAAFVPGYRILSTRLQGVRVLVQETYGALIAEAPVLYASDTQINFQLPFETFGRSAVLLVVDNNGNLSEPHSVQVVPSSPGVFIWGANRAVAVNENNSVNTSENPATRSSIVTLYMTGQGVVTPPLPSGSAATTSPLIRAPLPAQVWVGGVPAKILFVGLAPDLVGVLQLNFEVPEGAPSGDSPVVVNLGGWTSNTPLLTIK